MAASSDMRFQIRTLPEQRSFQLPEDFVRDALSVIPGQAELANGTEPAGIAVDVDVSEEQGTVLARGHLAGGATVACSRCLGPVKLTVDEDFMLTFLPHDKFAETEDDDLELDEEDIDLAAHDGKEVDLTPVLRDHIVLSVPYAPLCAEDCLGLCPQCGTDLNRGTCQCKPDQSDSPWSALKKLKVE